MEQARHNGLILAYLSLLSALPALTTDMYLPALPQMAEQFQTSVGVANLTLVLFFVFFSLALLVWGALSDKYGRKPVILTGTALYTAASILSAVSWDIYLLIFFRVLQAIGGGAAVSVAMAVMKDVFQGRARERALAISSALFALGPILAPSIGAAVLTVTSWRGIFLVLSVLGGFSFLCGLVFGETAEKDGRLGLFTALGNLVRTLGNPGFRNPMLVFSFTSIPIFAYLGAAADIYISGFGLSEQAFSFFFGANALVGTAGPMVYLLLSRRFSVHAIITGTFVLFLLSGLLVMSAGLQGPFLFALTVLPSTIGVMLLRTPSAALLLKQVDREAGAASSLINFSMAFVGSMGLQVISLDWGNRILVFGLMNVMAGLVGLIFFPMASRRCRTG